MTPPSKPPERPAFGRFGPQHRPGHWEGHTFVTRSGSRYMVRNGSLHRRGKEPRKLALIIGVPSGREAAHFRRRLRAGMSNPERLLRESLQEATPPQEGGHVVFVYGDPRPGYRFTSTALKEIIPPE